MSETSWHVEARALKQERPGLTLAEIGARFGKAESSVWRVLNPERYRELESRPRRRRQKRGHDRKRAEGFRGTCERCGGQMGAGVREDGICKACRSDHKVETNREIQRMWLRRDVLADIARDLGISDNALTTRMAEIRAAGWYLPQRVKGKSGVWLNHEPICDACGRPTIKPEGIYFGTLCDCNGRK